MPLPLFLAILLFLIAQGSRCKYTISFVGNDHAILNGEGVTNIFKVKAAAAVFDLVEAVNETDFDSGREANKRSDLNVKVYWSVARSTRRHH